MKLKQAIKNLGLKVNGVEPTGYYTTELLKSLGETLTGETITSTKITDIINEIAEKYQAPETPTEETPTEE